MTKYKSKKCGCSKHISSNMVNNICGKGCYDVCINPICGCPSILGIYAPVIYDELGVNLCTTFELGIDSGAPGLIISLGNFVLDFSVRTSDDSVTNARTAKHRFNEVPTTFWYRAVQIVTTDGNIVSEEVETDIALNLLEIKM